MEHPISVQSIEQNDARLLFFFRLDRRAKSRLIAAMILIGCCTLLGVAAWLQPSSEGMGTHQQLGLAPCGFYAGFGIPCATCGMTTSFAYAANGQLWLAFQTQPMGAVLCLLTAITVMISIWTLYSGMLLTPMLRQIWRPRTFLFLAVGLLLSWVYKIAVVLMHT